MKPKTKSLIALLVTLIIGVVIGALAWSTIHNQRIRKIREARNERGGFHSMVESRVAPIDPAVEDDFRRIVESYRMRLHDYIRESHRRRDAILDSMITDLDSVLTDEQTMRLRDWVHDDDERDGNRRDGDRKNGDADDSRSDRSSSDQG